jgi:hypothetical protein
MNFATPPTWMFNTTSWSYPTDPDDVTPPPPPSCKQVDWGYEQGVNPKSLTDLGDYFGRLAAHYMAGGFVDENGVFQSSPYHYNFTHW